MDTVRRNLRGAPHKLAAYGINRIKTEITLSLSKFTSLSSKCVWMRAILPHQSAHPVPFNRFCVNHWMSESS